MTTYTAKIEALEAALGSGELEVVSNGDKVTYRSAEEIRQALAYFRQQQSALTPSTTPGGFGFSTVGFCRE